MARSTRVLLVTAALRWAPIAVAVTALCLLLAAAVQQVVRTGADDPQVQIAEDAATRLNAGAPADAVIPGESVEIAASLAPWVLVVDGSGSLLTASATLHGQPPRFPESVFASVPQGHGQDRISWQPEPGVRSAVVVQRWKGGYVVAGRSLRRPEEVEAHLEQIVVAGWLATLALAAVATLAATALAPRSERTVEGVAARR